jgi:hypothetical protein
MYDLDCVVANVRAARQPVMLEYLDGNSVFYHDQYVRYELDLLQGVTVPWRVEQLAELDFRRECLRLDNEASPARLNSTQRDRVFATKPMNPSMVLKFHKFESSQIKDLETVYDFMTLAFITSVASQQVKADELLKALKFNWGNVPIIKVVQIYTGGYMLLSEDDHVIEVEDVVALLQQRLN